MLESIQTFFTADASLWGMLAGSFLAATLIPISSELMLVGALRLHPEMAWQLWAVATLGNSAGGMTTYLMGRWLPHRHTIRHEAQIRRFGAASLLLSWVPLAGDALCLGAGWLRLAWLPCLIFMTLGKAARYAVITEFF